MANKPNAGDPYAEDYHHVDEDDGPPTLSRALARMAENYVGMAERPKAHPSWENPSARPTVKPKKAPEGWDAAKHVSVDPVIAWSVVVIIGVGMLIFCNATGALHIR
tara:strand:- start:285 stop:605 length:321 start_codon:yes stop_codon:yes gene_type:complete